MYSDQQFSMMGYPPQHHMMHHMPHTIPQQYPQPSGQRFIDPNVHIAKVQQPMSVRKELLPEPKEKMLPSWRCGLCATSNLAGDDSCCTCKAPRILEENVMERIEPNVIKMKNHVVPTQQCKKIWKCPYCAYENNSSVTQCLMCSRSLPHQQRNDVIIDPISGLGTADRQKIVME